VRLDDGPAESSSTTSQDGVVANDDEFEIGGRLELLLGSLLLFYAAVAPPTFIAARAVSMDAQWMAWVPLLNVFLLAGMAHEDDAPNASTGCALIIAFFVPLVNLIAYGWVWSRIARSTGQHEGLGWACVVPIVNWVVPWIIALRAQSRANQQLA
jgi:hypothetical protein